MNYISIYPLYLCLIFVLSYGVESFVPIERVGHSSVLVGDRLYFFGGERPDIYSNEVFYLNLSQSFDVGNPSWNDLTPKAAISFGSSFATSAFDNMNNDQNIYLLGGAANNVNTEEELPKTPFVHKFNVDSSTWDIPQVNGPVPERREEITAVNDNSGKIYIFGGYATKSSSILNEMLIFNTVELSLSIVATRLRLSSYSATLLSNGFIVYVGGYTTGELTVDISKINLYDTKSSEWSEKTAKFTNRIENRSGHTAVLAPNDQIIIFGGITDNYARPSPDIAVLNIKTESVEWITPSVSSNIEKIDKFPSLTGHTANLVGNYMIVAFGNTTQETEVQLKYSSSIYLMDIRTYTWVNSFDLDKSTNNNSIPNQALPPSTSSTPTSNTGNHENHENNAIKITIIIAVGAVVIISAISAFLIYKYRTAAVRRKNQNQNLESSDCNVLVADQRL